MPALPLKWKKGEGYDIHLLRSGPQSKKLIDTLDLESGQADLVTFRVLLAGGTDRDGLEIDTVAGGIVKALPHPDPSFPKVNNFLLFALFHDPATGIDYQTEIRVHIHDSVKDIWLTPSTLTIHQDANECRFTVLARFNDDCIGDITDWPDSILTYQSANQSVVTMLTGGVLKAEPAIGSAQITVNLRVPALGIDKTSAPATALAKPSWSEIGAQAKVEWRAGKVRPDESKPDTVRSIIENATNILFVAEGFRLEHRSGFRSIVDKVIHSFRSVASFQPFNLLKDSINYWMVFVPSEQDGISALGEYVIFTDQARLKGALLQPPLRPAPDATEWRLLELIHQVGLPIQADAARSIDDMVKKWKQLYGDSVTKDRVKKAFTTNWKQLSFRTLLNERDSAFGMAVGGHPRVSQHISDVVELGVEPDARRTSEASIKKFIESLTFAGQPIGSTWKEGEKDFGLVCFICLTDRDGGAETVRGSYFAVTTGSFGLQLNMTKVSNFGLDMAISPLRNISKIRLAAVLAHEAGHAVGDLGNEYGDGEGGASTVDPSEMNVQAESTIVTAPLGYDVAKIKWLWPRITKAAVVPRKIEQADINNDGIFVPLLRHHGRTFAIGDVVRFMEWSIHLAAHFDVFTDEFFRVKIREDDSVTIVPVTVTPGSNAVTDIPMSGFNSTVFLNDFSNVDKLSLIQPRREAGKEIKLVAESILKHIEDKDRPLNARPGVPMAPCEKATSLDSVMTPTNLPVLSKTPRTKADIIGIYEGGNGYDCGVFHPAGRCKMRDSNVSTTPFCHVCRYLIVDRVDPTKHNRLDKLYPDVKP